MTASSPTAPTDTAPQTAPGTAPGTGRHAAPAVVVDSVSKQFRTRTATVEALQDVSLQVRRGELVSLIGPSGCGKSTLLRVIADLEAPTSGTVTVNGKSARQARLDQDYGIAFQSAGLLEWRTVARNVELPLELHGVARRARRTRSRELLALVGLADFAGSWPSELSGGMQQRVAIARALAENPSLLLMDEPFGALDEMTRERMQNELVRIAGETQAAVVFVTHSIPEAVFLSDRVVVMSARPGRISHVVPVPLGARDEDVREAGEFYTCVTAVREALRGRRVPAPPAGADLR